jgi:hypothetical protein
MYRLWHELRRRHVLRAGIFYALVAWVLAQVADLVLDNFNGPKWVIQSFLFLLAAGFPVALIIAWAFELTPRGFRREGSTAAAAGAKDLLNARQVQTA